MERSVPELAGEIWAEMGHIDGPDWKVRSMVTDVIMGVLARYDVQRLSMLVIFQSNLYPDRPARSADDVEPPQMAHFRCRGLSSTVAGSSRAFGQSFGVISNWTTARMMVTPRSE
jgi:hypothetical protein